MIDEVLPLGDKRRSALDKIRKGIAELETKAAAIIGANLSPQEAADRLIRAARIEQEHAATALAYFCRPSAVGHPALPERTFGLELLLVGEDEVRSRLEQYFGSIIAQSGLPTAEREAAIAKLSDEVAKLRGAEEKAVLDLEQKGFVVDRRTPETSAEIEQILRAWDE